MKRDFELIYKILKWFEELPPGTTSQEQKPRLDGYDEKLVEYNRDLLKGAGFLNGNKLTWAGCDLLDDLEKKFGAQ